MPSAQPADRGGIAHPAVYREWMGLALDAAARTDASADVPIGAVVIDAAGTIIGIGCNERELRPLLQGAQLRTRRRP